jgi:hypothetical protein
VLRATSKRATALRSRILLLMLSHKTRRGLVLLAAVAGGALLVLARNGVPPPRQWPAAQGQMVCGAGVALCGVLTLQTGLGQGAYNHPTPSVHGLWPEVAPYGTSECAKPSLSTADPRRVVQCYGATGEGTSHIVEFETHEWEKHGECAGVRDARAYLTTVCGLAEQPLQAMTAARKAGGGLDSARRAVMGLGIEIFAVDEQHSQLLLSACSDGDTWTLSPVEKFPEACGQRRVARSRPVWAVVCALALVFYVLVRAGTDVPPKTTCDEEPPALTKQQLALLEAGDKPSKGSDEKPSPPSSTWSEIAPPSVSSAESWAEVSVAPAPDDGEAEEPTHIPDVAEKTRFSHAIYRMTPEEMGVLLEKIDRLCPDAIDKNTKEEIEINIDKIDARTFRELDRYVRECLAGKPRARPYGQGHDGQPPRHDAVAGQLHQSLHTVSISTCACNSSNAQKCTQI